MSVLARCKTMTMTLEENRVWLAKWESVSCINLQCLPTTMTPRITGERNVADAVKCSRCDRLISSEGVKSCKFNDCVHVLKGIGFQPAPDMVNHPPHYRAGDTYETIRVIEAWKLNYNLGNTVKYISRADAKGDYVENLEKARWYLNREIDSLKISKALYDRNAAWCEEDEV